MRDEHDGDTPVQRLNRLQDEALVVGIECAGGFVENQQRRLPQQRARQCKPLPFSSRQPHPPIAEHGVEPLWQRCDESIGGGLAERLEYLGVCGVWTRPAHVGSNGVVKQERLLCDVADLLPPRGQVCRVERDVVDEHASTVRRQQPEHEIGQCALARTGHPTMAVVEPASIVMSRSSMAGVFRAG